MGAERLEDSIQHQQVLKLVWCRFQAYPFLHVARMRLRDGALLSDCWSLKSLDMYGVTGNQHVGKYIVE